MGSRGRQIQERLGLPVMMRTSPSEFAKICDDENLPLTHGVIWNER